MNFGTGCSLLAYILYIWWNLDLSWVVFGLIALIGWIINILLGLMGLTE